MEKPKIKLSWDCLINNCSFVPPFYSFLIHSFFYFPPSIITHPSAGDICHIYIYINEDRTTAPYVTQQCNNLYDQYCILFSICIYILTHNRKCSKQRLCISVQFFKKLTGFASFWMICKLLQNYMNCKKHFSTLLAIAS